jgi:hypothetical protein
MYVRNWPLPLCVYSVGGNILFVYPTYWARICKRLWSPGIDSEESISPAYVACRAGTTNRVVVPACQPENRFLGSIKDLQIRAMYCTITLQNLSTFILFSGYIVEVSFFTHRHIYSLCCKTLAFAISLLISHNGEAMLMLQAHSVFSTYTYLLQQKHLIRTYSTIPKWLVCIVRTVLSKTSTLFLTTPIENQ